MNNSPGPADRKTAPPPGRHAGIWAQRTVPPSQPPRPPDRASLMAARGASSPWRPRRAPRRQRRPNPQTVRWPWTPPAGETPRGGSRQRWGRSWGLLPPQPSKGRPRVEGMRPPRTCGCTRTRRSKATPLQASRMMREAGAPPGLGRRRPKHQRMGSHRPLPSPQTPPAQRTAGPRPLARVRQHRRTGIERTAPVRPGARPPPRVSPARPTRKRPPPPPRRQHLARPRGDPGGWSRAEDGQQGESGLALSPCWPKHDPGGGAATQSGLRGQRHPGRWPSTLVVVGRQPFLEGRPPLARMAVAGCDQVVEEAQREQARPRWGLRRELEDVCGGRLHLGVVQRDL